jgi:hypothetical protein
VKRLALLALVLCGCVSFDRRIAEHRTAYLADTVLQERMLEPLALEPAHGQVTLVVTQRFAEKLVLASLRPNLLTIGVASAGEAWRSEGKRLGLSYINTVTLRSGSLEIHLDASDLRLDADMVQLRTVIAGQGVLNADLHFFGVTLNRDVTLHLRHDEPLTLRLEASNGGWQLRAVGPPLHAEVEVELPAARVAGTNLYEVQVARTLEIPLSVLQPWPVPLPAPREVDVGTEKVRIGLQHALFGAHGGVLWLGADVLVEDPPAQTR